MSDAGRTDGHTRRRLRIGHTAITWKDDQIAEATRSLAELGFQAIEVFAWVLEKLSADHATDLFAQHNIPLVSSYFVADVLDRDRRVSEMAKLERWARIVREIGGSVAVFGAGSIDRRSYRFVDHRSDVAAFVNEAARRIADIGLTFCFHPHTGTPIESEAEIDGLMDAVDARFVGFAPDVGQLQKGGADPRKIVERYLAVTRHIHLKDFCGRVEHDGEGREIDATGFQGYTPLGQGIVDLVGILDVLETSTFSGYIMVELDDSEAMPMTAAKAAAINRKYLEQLGYRF